LSLELYRTKIERNITDINFSRLSQISTLFGLTVIGLLSHGENEKNCKQLLEEKDKEMMRLQKRLIELL